MISLRASRPLFDLRPSDLRPTRLRQRNTPAQLVAGEADAVGGGVGAVARGGERGAATDAGQDTPAGGDRAAIRAAAGPGLPIA